MIKEIKNIRYRLLIIVLLLDAIYSSGRIAHAQTPSIELEDVFVTATRQPESMLTVPAHVTVITSEEIESSNATDVGDLLREEGGLWVTNITGSSPIGLIIDGRGFNNGGGNGGRTLVLIDGRRSNLVDTSNPDWASIPIDTIARIEIVRGSASALYGDNAVAGVINIITKQGVMEPASGVSLERGSYDFWKRTASFSGLDGDLSYYLYGSYETSSGYRENSDYRASNYVGTFQNNISPYTTLHFRGSYMDNDLLFPGALTEADIQLVGREGSVTNEDQAGTRLSRTDVGIDSYLNESQWIELTGGQTLRAQDSLITSPGAGYTEIDSDSRSSLLTGKYRMTGRMAGLKSRLLVGLDLLKETVQSDSFSNFPDPFFPYVVSETTNYERRQIGVYANEEVSLPSFLILNLSGRMDRSEFQFSQIQTDLSTSLTTRSSGERSFRTWSPAAGLTFLTSPSTSLFVNWSRSFRFPNRDELTGIFGITPDLDPERATTFESGSTIRAGQKIQMTASVYTMRVENEILFIPPGIGVFAFGDNQNIPEVEHKGLEFSAKFLAGDGVRVNGSYSVTRTRILEGPFTGSRLPITPKHSGHVTLRLGKEKGFQLTATDRISGKRIPANDLANVQKKLPVYSVINVRLGYKGENLDLFFGSNNVFNREYEEFGGVGGFPFGSRIGINPSPKRHFIWGGTLRF